MGLTPNEIRNQEFSSSFRGYTRSEVEALKEAAATALEEARVEILKLAEEKDALKGKYQDLKNLEETLKASVIEAQKGADQIIANSKKEAELIIAEAKRRRDDVIEQKHHNLAELETRIHELEFAKKSFYAKFKSDLEGYLKLIDQAEAYGQNIIPPKSNETPPADSPPPAPSPEMFESSDSDIDRIVEQFRQEGGEEN